MLNNSTNSQVAIGTNFSVSSNGKESQSDFQSLSNLSRSSPLESKVTIESNANFNKSNNTNNANSNKLTTNENNSEQPQEEGIFSRMVNYIKSLNPWRIEEEEFYDAHGFKCKRPKTKIPLRKQKDSFENELQKVGGQSMAYAAQSSGFGNIFL